ncbi:MAG: flagellar export protein FliJ [Spirochaetaceae bacterium]|jgi:flagellar export protein FliJ|nr:flagellar export protein FliJ [Spirochaetaceae bacterium]
MKKFTFSLEKILKLRGHAENSAKTELGRAVSALSQIENKLASLAIERKSVMEKRFSGGNNMPYIHLYDKYEQRLDAVKEQLIKDAAEASLAVEEARELWIEARAGLKALENLKERKFASYRKENQEED